ncbi:hypothetical protein HBI56_212450 [Parastagonospora nodorum]|uniref:Uncharacterized protein n=1 Tax=Phaeosphaeria nodorum (strain SN15 / ATCC MYA-4574 / FGSC 10173) TaxID=321614 RepID=A0A7U2FE91_PHANO|nr:hypothetical protein HBH56_229620 [Parastagonospora nodorum]QRD03644.1 hypothetical protein JI435_442230 [Parastagonospora nodorum SN15]KAH3921799.1 hypothetical protein HBH54_233130 [Parastagonospora nodorum]KAH3939883.1 hypothetical protein HBH53_227010 [Parastagonospora nodorum]KAH3960814.1 hypothetical protein HBH52_234900 [Parastagonospora nodorum]
MTTSVPGQLHALPASDEAECVIPRWSRCVGQCHARGFHQAFSDLRKCCRRLLKAAVLPVSQMFWVWMLVTQPTKNKFREPATWEVSLLPSASIKPKDGSTSGV